jgi:hypothetical protein
MAKNEATKSTVTMVNIDAQRPVGGFSHDNKSYRAEKDGSFEIETAHIETARSHHLKVKGEGGSEPAPAADHAKAIEELREQGAELLASKELYEDALKKITGEFDKALKAQDKVIGDLEKRLKAVEDGAKKAK